MSRYQTDGTEKQRKLTARLFAIGGLFALAYGILISRAVFFHLKDNDEVSRVAMRQYRTAVKKSTERGKILDAVGREMAINIPSESVYADPRFVTNPAVVAKGLSRIIGMDEAKLTKLLSSNRRFVWIKRGLSHKEVELINEGNFPGIFLMSENGRSYPNAELAASVLGMVGVDATGLSGVEFQYNDYMLLNPLDDEKYGRDARGHIYLSPSSSEGAEKFNNLELTIDKTIQFIAEKELSGAVRSSKAKAGIIIVLDPRNGDVLAMSNFPSFDPNDFEKKSPDAWKNKAIADVYEPGSTFKTIVVSAALDKKIVGRNQIFDCSEGTFKVGKVAIKDAHPHKKLSVADIIKVSSNVGAAQIGTKVGKENLYKFIKGFGFGKITGVDIPGESAGILSQPNTWSDMQLATISFGHGIGATPLQMAVAFASVVNGGELLMPHVVKRIIDNENKVVYERQKEIVGNPISRETSVTMRELLERVVGEDGTGVLAASAEYLVGGKTGTAQKASSEGGYLKDKYYSSFIGFAPVGDPRVVVYVGIDEPQGYYYGGQVAAPVFKEVTEKVLKYANVPSDPALNKYVHLGATKEQLIADGLAFNDDADEPKESDLKKNEDGPLDQKVQLVESGMWMVPDFTGLTIKDVMEVVRESKINLKFVGSGIAVRQSLSEGTVVPSGADVTVEFRPLM